MAVWLKNIEAKIVWWTAQAHSEQFSSLWTTEWQQA